MATTPPPWSRLQSTCSFIGVSNESDYDLFLRQSIHKGNILQYSKNKVPLTKAQEYAYMTRRSGVDVRKCATERYGFSPSTSSDIPGPLTMIYWDNRGSTYNPRVSRTMSTSTQRLNYKQLIADKCRIKPAN